MNLQFASIIAFLSAAGVNFAFTIANAARPPEDYLFAQYLPERRVNSYYVESGSMRVIPTMAGLVGMDSPYPPGGAMSLSTFLEKVAKLGNKVTFTEAQLREIHRIVSDLRLAGAGGTAEARALAEVLLNFTSGVLVQGHLDSAEWLRAQAMLNGQINWTFNDITLAVNYNFPAGHLVPTATSTEAYGGSASTFWTDHRVALSLLNYNVREISMHPTTWDVILSNSVNNFEVINQGNNGLTFTVRRRIGSTERVSSDARDGFTVRLYEKQGQLLDPANPTAEPTKVDFFTQGKILYVGRDTQPGFRIGEGARPDPLNDRSLGYTHLAPTVEGGGPGRYANVYVPEGRPYNVVGEAAQNVLPVIENPSKIVVLSTEMPA